MRMPPPECIVYFEYIVYARPASFQIKNGGCMLRIHRQPLCLVFEVKTLILFLWLIFRIFVDSDNEDDETKFVDDDDEDKITTSVVKMENDDDDEEDELDKFMAGIEVRVKPPLLATTGRSGEVFMIFN